VGQVIDWVRQGRITDVKTIIGALWLEKIVSGAWQPGEQASRRSRRRAAG
jgi:ADP-ribose pyrophosphatase